MPGKPPGGVGFLFRLASDSSRKKPHPFFLFVWFFYEADTTKITFNKDSGLFLT